MSIIETVLDANWHIFLVHALLYPLYQILGTAKHEYAHAIAGKIQGLDILEITILPERVDGIWYWGRVRFIGKANVLTLIAPYIVDLIFMVIGIGIFKYFEPFLLDHINMLFMATIIFIFSPLVDLIYNLLKWVLCNSGDFAKAFGKPS